MYKNSMDKLLYKWIDIRLGLKYLNENVTLYLKVLENFLNRYQTLMIEGLSLDERKETLHSIKGLSATLGMTQLAKVSEKLYSNDDVTDIEPFKRVFHDTLNELQMIVAAANEPDLATTILILDENIDDIDEMVEVLDNWYDVLVALDLENAVTILQEERIDLTITTLNFSHHIKRWSKENELIYIVESLETLEDREKGFGYITKPLKDDQLIKCIQTQLKLQKIFKLY